MILDRNPNSVECKRLARIAWVDRLVLAPLDRTNTTQNFDEMVRIATSRATTISAADVERCRELCRRIQGHRLDIMTKHELDMVVSANESEADTAARLKRPGHGLTDPPDPNLDANAAAEAKRLHALLASCPVPLAQSPRNEDTRPWFGRA